MRGHDLPNTRRHGLAVVIVVLLAISSAEHIGTTIAENADARVETPEPELNRAFDYVRDFWPELIRPGYSVALPLPGRFVMPGGFFEWFFYWDSYFIILGLVVQGEWELAQEIVDNLIYEVEVFGFVPNYNAPDAVCRSRSQPPYLTSAIREVYPYVQDRDWLERAYSAAATEYLGYWLAEPHVTATGLSRYYDTGLDGCITVPNTPHFRAMAESGWDNTPRFGDDVSQVLPADLNSQLYRYELDLAQFADLLGKATEAEGWRSRAEARRTLINRYLWDEEQGFYLDYGLRTEDRVSSTPRCLSSYVPLWAGVASETQAARMIDHLLLFEQGHGLATCEPGWDDGTQHNYPVGWAYSHWYVAYGLRRYGYNSDATRITMKWLRIVAHKLDETGAMWERYNVVNPDEPAAGRYPIQEGFGWTNSVFAALLARIVFGVEPDMVTGEPIWGSSLPEEWHGKDGKLHLPSYPWTEGPPENLPPLANFTHQPAQPLRGEDVRFNDESVDPENALTSWLWNFGDGSSSTERNPIHAYSEPGTYSVVLNVTDDEGNTATKTLSISVTPSVSDREAPQEPAPGYSPQLILILLVGATILVLLVVVFLARRRT